MLDRKSPPPFVHSTSFDLITPVRKKLSNGIDLFIVSGGEQHVIKIELVFQAGRWFEREAGVSHFAAQLLNKGTRKKSSFQIAQIFDRYGAHIDIHPGQDYLSVSVYGLTEYVAPVLELLMEIISQPAFPEKEFEQSKSIFIQNLKVNEEKTSFLASKAFRKNLFGASHPYGREIEESDVHKLSTDQLASHYNTNFQDLTAFVSGKVDRDAEQLLITALSGYKTGVAPTRTFPPTASRHFHQRIEKPGSVQSSIRMGKLAMNRNHQEYAEAVFVAHILGGYFGSRLMKNIREEKGLTYGIYASLHPLQHDGYLVIGADVNKENVDLTIDEISKELKNLRTQKISSEELHISKNHFIGSLQSEISTPFAHADKIKTIFLSGLPDDFYHNMVLTIDSITPDRIIEISTKHFHEDSLNQVAVG